MDFNKQTSKICPACKTEFKIIYYQRRAADEPPDKVIYCDKCPLDTTRLSFNIASKLSIEPTRREVKPITNYSSSKDVSSTLCKTDTRTYIIVRGNAAARCYKSIQDRTVQPETMTAISVNISTGIKSIKSYYYLNSSTIGEAHITTDSDIIAPYVVCKSTDIYTSYVDSDEYKGSSDRCIVGYEYDLPTISNSSHTVLRTLHDGQRPYILVSLSNCNKSDILSVLESILVTYGTELSIKSIVSSTILNTLYIQSGRAYDLPSAPETGYMYAWKPDGERFWYIKYGSIWLFSRRLLSGRIAGWNMSTSLQTFHDIGPVLDVEVMIGFPPILIDILISDNGQSMPISRTLDYVLDEYNYIKENGSVDIPIHIREYYTSAKKLLSTKDTLEYPVDGLVGIKDGSMTIVKIKDEKSIELQLQEDGDLITSDNHVVAKSNMHETEEVGSIIEIRFVKEVNLSTPTIKEIFVRTDKTKANDIQACYNIFNTTSDSPDSLARRGVVQWCNSIRSKLHQVASKSGSGRVILDIGAGDGQAVSDYSSNPEITYLLLEPNIKKCNSMLRRLQDLDRNNSRLLKQPSDILNALRLLSTSKVKYVVLCATLKDILQQKDCLRVLKTCVRCCIASLSISYIVPELQELAIEGLNVIGFGYMYDLVNSKGELVNEYGVVMKYISYSTNDHSQDAVVQWGTDKAYTEPAITLEDFKEVFYCKLARNTVPIIADSSISLLTTISNTVYIISSSKYIL
jgi:hypothetical protein